MDDAVSIRSARAADHAQLSALFGSLDRLHRDGAPWLVQEPASDPRPRSWLEAQLADPRVAILVADAGRCIGLATVRLRDTPMGPQFIQQQYAVIEDVAVDPGWRQKGVGRRLCDACEAWARGRGAAWMEINVYDFNSEAQAFYTALGYAPTMHRLRKPFA